MTKALLHRLAGITSVAALAGTLGFMGMSASPASASQALQLLPTTLTQTGSAATVHEGAPQTITLTATVSGLTLYVTPRGTVTFNVHSPTDSIYLPPSLSYTVPLSQCIILIDRCTASVTIPTSGLEVGLWDSDAQYSGDSLSQPSDQGYDFTVEAPY
jgi:hypothetical protein